MSLAGDFNRVCGPVLYRVGPKRFALNEDLHVQRLGGVLTCKLHVPFNICVLMVY